MDSTVITPRLKLTLVRTADRGTPELAWFHELRTNEKTTWWSIYGQAKSLEDTERFATRCLTSQEGYKVAYAVHELLPPDSGSENEVSQLIGLVTLMRCGPDSLPLPEELTLPASAAATTLTVELGYQFLPKGWGKGYATEGVNAVLEACKRAKSFWAPYEKVYVRAIVNHENPASLRVMSKTPMQEKGIHEWTGDAVWLAGAWRETGTLHIWGMHLLK